MVDDDLEHPVDAYRELFERSADPILIIEGDRFVDCNQATVDILRYRDKQQLLQTHPSELSPPTQPDGRDSYRKANENMEIAFERGSHRFEWDHVRADGEVFPVEVLLTAIREHGRRTLHVVWRDLTSRRRLEHELRHAQKMEAIGKLTGGIAHDFNNLLVAVLGNADLLEAELAEQPRALGYASAITQAGRRAADLVRQLLAFGRKQLLQPTVLDLNGLTRDLDVLLRNLVGEGVAIHYELCDDELPIFVDRTQIEQALLNLAANARDAMAGEGRLTIETAVANLGDVGSGVGDPALPVGEYAVLRVQDEGTGMSEAVAARAFDPFFTTKEPGEGTGLGLATVYGVARQSGGSARIESVEGQGSVVEIVLPLRRGGLAPPAPNRAHRAPRRHGGGVVLVVEDEPMVRRLVRATLEASGYRVLLAADGREAERLFREHACSVDLLLTDVMMPRAGGPELVQRLREQGHDPRVVFMSGYADDRLEDVQRRFGEITLLAKPFTVDELLATVQAAIGAAG